MKVRIQPLKEAAATSKWLEHLTISMITQPEPLIIVTLGEVQLKELKDSTLIVGWKEQTRASCRLARTLPQVVVPKRFPCRTLTIKEWEGVL